MNKNLPVTRIFRPWCSKKRDMLLQFLFQGFDFGLIREVADILCCYLFLKTKNFLFCLRHQKDLLHIRFLEWRLEGRNEFLTGFHNLFF